LPGRDIKRKVVGGFEDHHDGAAHAKKPHCFPSIHLHGSAVGEIRFWKKRGLEGERDKRELEEKKKRKRNQKEVNIISNTKSNQA
jgi:hypothetical protein